jgi:hypothetical protein
MVDRLDDYGDMGYEYKELMKFYSYEKNGEEFLVYCVTDSSDCNMESSDSCGGMYPILRPIGDIIKTIRHNGEEIIPLLECAKKARFAHFPLLSNWEYIKNDKVVLANDFSEISFKYHNEIDLKGFYAEKKHTDISFLGFKFPESILNIPELYSYLDELKIDYMDLIPQGLAIDVNTIDEKMLYD